MAIDFEAVNRMINNYVADVRSIMKIDCAYLYGSYAKGGYSEYSDVDICFFSEEFKSKRKADILTPLFGLARKYHEISIEPNAFPTSEMQNGNPFVQEILSTGREI